MNDDGLVFLAYLGGFQVRRQHRRAPYRSVCYPASSRQLAVEVVNCQDLHMLQ